MQEPINTIEYKGHNIEIYQDENTESPQKWGNTDVFLVGYHRDFTVEEDKIITNSTAQNLFTDRKELDAEDREAVDAIKKQYHVFGLEAYIHSDVSLAKEWQRKQRGKYTPDKLRCIICGKWYVQVGSHVQAVHNMTAREYREAHDLPLLRGVVPAWYRKMKGKIAKENGTAENLQKGKQTRYKKGDKRARVVTGWKGRAGSLGYTPDEYYQ